MPRCHGLLDLQPRTRWCSAAGAARLDRSGSADGCPVCRATGNGDRDRSQVPVLELVPAPAAHECVAEVVQRTAPHQESRTERGQRATEARKCYRHMGKLMAALLVLPRPAAVSCPVIGVTGGVRTLVAGADTVRHATAGHRRGLSCSGFLRGVPGCDTPLVHTDGNGGNTGIEADPNLCGVQPAG